MSFLRDLPYRFVQPRHMAKGMFQMTQISANFGSGTSVNFTKNWGAETQLAVLASGSGFLGGSAGIVIVTLLLDGGLGTDLKVYTNEIGSHKCLVPQVIVYDGMAKGSHTFSWSLGVGVSTDSNDFFSLTIFETPAP